MSMSKAQATEFFGNRLVSMRHRTYGPEIYVADCDMKYTTHGIVEGKMIEYSFIDNEPQSIAHIDYKHPGDCKSLLSDRPSTIRVQIGDANKIGIPFFICVYYLEPKIHDIPMYYPIPCNVLARSIFSRHGWSLGGEWMTEYHYVRFHHILHKIPFDGEIKIDEDALAINGMCRGMKLKDHCKTKKIYKLPPMDFSWLQQKAA